MQYGQTTWCITQGTAQLSMVMLIYIDLLFQPFGDRLDLPTYQGFPDSSVKNPPVTQETLVRFLGSEDPLEKG